MLLLHSTSVLGLLMLLASGCSAPIALEGNPSVDGLLILEPRFEREFIMGIDVYHDVADGAVANLDRVDVRIKGVTYGDLLVFSVPAGQYIVQRLATAATFWSNWDSYGYVFRAQELPDNLKSMEVRAGTTTYVGPIFVREASGFSGIKTTVDWEPDVARERSILRWIQDDFEDDRWNRMVEARLAELDGP